jgi:hypothetical protein
MINLTGGYLYYSLGASAWYLHIDSTHEIIKLRESDYPIQDKAVAKAEYLIARAVMPKG